ncbi:MAG: hypothetical protein JSW04_07360 [Desulfobacterales bacterium]|nr:MAG: hypothetical protein JSV38_16015 [Desulfobacterales bacterium]UCD91226.1 MAG: hypothetical protein JSW04_07360 [Desulfobacterales bacterium]
MKIELKVKLFLLKKIYLIYDDFVSSLAVACKKYCSRCFTNNVIMTSLEGYFIAESIVKKEHSDVFERVKAEVSKQRFLPRTTINKIAELCINGEDLPQEDHTHAESVCPLLTDDACAIYNVRPFGCRCLMSKHDCRQQGYAYVDAFVLSVNHLFLQFIEHVDANGFSGNLSDMLTFMASEENRCSYKTDTLKNSDTHLLWNLPIKVLMIPPEHRVRIQPILNALHNINGPVSKMNCSF